MSKTIIDAIETELSQARNRVSALETALSALKAGPGDVAQPKPGDRMPDGTVYVGLSPASGRPLYTMPHDLPDLHTCEAAKTAAAAQTFGGHTNWRVPTIEELDALYRARNAIGGFIYCYWSSTEHDSNVAWYQHFKNGNQLNNLKHALYRVRCVRSG